MLNVPVAITMARPNDTALYKGRVTDDADAIDIFMREVKVARAPQHDVVTERVHKLVHEPPDAPAVGVIQPRASVLDVY